MYSQASSEINTSITKEFARGDYATKKDIKEVKIKISQLEVKIEKGFKEVIVWVVGAIVAIGGLSIAIIQLF